MVDEWMCDMIKRFPAIEVHFGAESAVDRVLKLMGKNITGTKNQQAIDLLNSRGIKTTCSFIIGWPTETEEELIATYEFLMKNLREGNLQPNCSMNILSPMPGTKVWNDAVREGKIDPNNLDYKRFSIFASYRTSNVGSFEAWCDIRRQNNSIYLNEEYVPQERLYQIMREYENRILTGSW
jgi:radical SAM superfamily enzyme YgiQ (UPF0313 family)